MKFDIYENVHSLTVASFYEMAVKKGYDFNDFVVKTLTSDFGVFLFDRESINLWTCPAYILDWFEDEMEFLPKQRVYQSDPMFVGFLYRYWMLTRDLSSREVYGYAPFNVVDALYPRLHVVGFECAVLDLMDVHNGVYGIETYF